MGPPLLRSVLLVDDSLMFRKLLGDLFRDLGVAEIVEMPTGWDAMQYLREGRPDLVCVDLVLPDVSGFGVCEHIRATPGLAHLPVLVVSSRHEPEAKARAEQVGATGYLAKPFTVEDFGACVRQVLETASARS
ncbi:response regulator [Melittangium boletus]|uniref:response regulator n=1 Tax=Melittangium boletus TaxID=83453 RepID=UPI003DA29BB8